MLKRALLIAYHFPPLSGGSGIHRTLSFARHLPKYGWQSIVLSIHPRAYPAVSQDRMEEIPEDVIVERAFGLDSARHLAIAGKYPDCLAYPDRWISWWPAAMLRGLALIKRYRPAVIWSTYPIATAHLVGMGLSKLTGIPWVADFRDSMWDEVFPSNEKILAAHRWIEERALRMCDRAVFTAPGTLELCANRYPDLDRKRYSVVENGYEEQYFSEKKPQKVGPNDRTTLIHSGLLYPIERDPSDFFSALADLSAERIITPESLRIRLRATGYDDLYNVLLKRLGLSKLVELAPPLSYAEALAEMREADGLLIFQATNCNHQIPAKLYEYFRAQRPIFSLTDPIGDTAQVLRAAGIDSIIPLDSMEGIRETLPLFLGRIRSGTAPIADKQYTLLQSRQERTLELSRLFSNLTSSVERSG